MQPVAIIDDTLFDPVPTDVRHTDLLARPEVSIAGAQCRRGATFCRIVGGRACRINSGGATTRIEFAQDLYGRVEALCKSLVERHVTEPFKFCLLGRVFGNFCIARLPPPRRDGNDACGGNRVPIRQCRLRFFIQRAGNIQLVGFLETAKRVLGAHAHLSVDHARTKADAVQDDLRLH